MFRTVSLSIIRSLALYTQQWYMSHWFCWLLASKQSAKPVYLVGFVIRIYHDARSSECQILHFKHVHGKFFSMKQTSTITTIISYDSVLVYDSGCSIMQIIRWKMFIVWTYVTQMASLKLSLISSSGKCNIIKPIVLGPLDCADL